MLALPLDKIDDADWRARFFSGDRPIIEAIYEEYFDALLGTATRILDKANAETVVHEVFYRLLANEAMRRSFQGGSLAAWLSAVTRNLAIDHQRRHKRETSDADAVDRAREPGRIADRVEARLVVERFRTQVLPPKWLPVFEARFIRQLDQREAARSIGIGRTTLAYRELRIRSLLKTFLLKMENS
jgi:RNA polymerase sigma-70 factor, ECF subfamily